MEKPLKMCLPCSWQNAVRAVRSTKGHIKSFNDEVNSTN